MTENFKHFWRKYRQNKSGIVALYVFIFFIITSVFADFIANEKPFLVYYDNHLYLPIFKNYPETNFGGAFAINTDYRSSVVQKHIEEKGWIIWPLIPYSYDTVNYGLKGTAPAPPSLENWLGTDDQGRDILAQLIHGIRFAVFFGLGVALLSGFIGFFMGAVQGYYGGRVDLIGQRFMEIWASLPILVVIMILTTFVVPNVYWIFIFMVFFKWLMMAVLTRAEFLKFKKREYVLAAEMMGVSPLRIIGRHIFPNMLSALIVLVPFMVIGVISSLTTLDYLGFGLPPGSPSLGEILHQGKNNLYAPWIGLSGITVLGILMISLVMVGQALRRTFDPYQNPQIDAW